MGRANKIKRRKIHRKGTKRKVVPTLKKIRRRKRQTGKRRKRLTGKRRKSRQGKRRRKQKKQKKKEMKEKKRRRKNKLKKRNQKKSGARQGPAGGDWSSCGTSGVNDTCLLNAVNALNFEKNQIQNFFKQKARLENQDKVTGNKKGKKGEFEDAAGYMLTAIGGNISSPSCGENSTRAQRAAADP